MTRVAGANSAIWGGIYRANADALVAAIDDMVARLTVARDMLAAGDDDGIADWNDAARDDRRRLLESDLAGGEVHELRVLVPNRPGIVAEIALALGRATIDIVDMGLYPSSGSHGTVALWIRGGVVAEQAERLVTRPRARGRRAHEDVDSRRPDRCAARCARPATSRCRTARRCSARCARTRCTSPATSTRPTRTRRSTPCGALGALVEEGAAGHADDPRARAARGRRGAHRRRQRRAR